MIIGISGLAGSGKDTAADFLVKNHGFVRIGLADPLKRICKEVFDFTDEQLWGPSSERDAPDSRYLRFEPEQECPNCKFGTLEPDGDRLVCRGECGQFIDSHLTPRHALQQLGTEWGRGCYEDVWIDYGLRVAQKLMTDDGMHYHYAEEIGLVVCTSGHQPCNLQTKGVVFSDIRFKNEMAAIKKAGFLWRMKRGKGLGGDAGLHPSEAEQGEVPDKDFDVVIDNNNITLQNLELVVSDRLGMLKARLKALL